MSLSLTSMFKTHQIRDCLIRQEALRTVLVLDIVAAGQSDSFGKVLKLVRQRSLLHDAALSHGHLAQGEVGAESLMKN